MWAIERKNGVYDFRQYDRFVNDCEKRGLKIIGCMAFSNKLYGHMRPKPLIAMRTDIVVKPPESLKIGQIFVSEVVCPAFAPFIILFFQRIFHRCGENDVKKLP